MDVDSVPSAQRCTVIDTGDLTTIAYARVTRRLERDTSFLFFLDKVGRSGLSIAFHKNVAMFYKKMEHTYIVSVCVFRIAIKLNCIFMKRNRRYTSQTGLHRNWK